MLVTNLGLHQSQELTKFLLSSFLYLPIARNTPIVFGQFSIVNPGNLSLFLNTPIQDRAKSSGFAFFMLFTFTGSVVTPANESIFYFQVSRFTVP